MSHLEGAQLAPELHAGGAPGGQARQLRRGVPLRQLGPGRLRRRCAENGTTVFTGAVSGTEPHPQGRAVQRDDRCLRRRCAERTQFQAETHIRMLKEQFKEQ